MVFKKPTDMAQIHAAVAEALQSDRVGSWSSDHNQEGKSFSGWNYLAIAAIGRQAARAHSYVYREAAPKAKAMRKSLKSSWGGIWRSMASEGAADLVGDENYIQRLVDRPNRHQSGALFQWEYIQQMHLHGCCLIYNRPTKDGTRTAARYIVPMSLTQPVYPGEDPSVPEGGIRIFPYQAGIGWYINPLISAIAGATISIRYLSVIRYPHPVLRGDGKSPTDAAGWWVDSATMIDIARWKHMKRGPKPRGIISVEGDEIQEHELDEIERRINRKLQDESYDEKAVAIGAKVTLGNQDSPTDMDYSGAFEQIGQSILAVHGVGKAMVGLTDNMTYGSLAAALQQSAGVVQSDLDMLSGNYNDLASDEGTLVEVEYEVEAFDDPTLIESQLGTDLQSGIRLGREWRAMRGLPPFGDWRDDARVTPQGLVYDPPEPPEQGKQRTPGSQQSDSSRFMFRSMAKANPVSESVTATERRPTVAVDLDNTLAEYDGDFSPDEIGTPIFSVIDDMAKLRDAGCDLIIFTCREDNELLRGWLDGYSVPYDAINENPGIPISKATSGKVFADVYYDDRAVNAEDGLEGIVEQLPESRAKARLQRLVSPQAKPDYGCIMLEVPESAAERIKQLHSLIPVEQLVEDGYEQWPHVTLLYGITGATPEEVVAEVRKIGAVDVELGPVGTFDRDGSSVVKLEAKSGRLHTYHRRLKEVFPVVETFPDYQPHITLAYVEQPGDLSGLDQLQGTVFRATHAVVEIEGKTIRVPLRRLSEMNGHAKSYVDSNGDAGSDVISRLVQPRLFD